MSRLKSFEKRLERIERKRPRRIVPLVPPHNSSDAEISALQEKHLRENPGDRDAKFLIFRTIYEKKPEELPGEQTKID